VNLKAVLPGLIFIGVGLYEAVGHWRLRSRGLAVEVESEGWVVRLFHRRDDPDRAVMGGWRGLLAPVIYLVIGAALLVFGVPD